MSFRSRASSRPRGWTKFRPTVSRPRKLRRSSQRRSHGAQRPTFPHGNGSTAVTLLRRFVSVDVAAGGVGKSSVKIGEALAMASNRDLYGSPVHDGPLNVWLYNLEDPSEESERRIHATAKWFHIKPEDVDGRLYVDSGRDQRCVIATETEYGARIAQPVYEQIKTQLLERKIDVLVIDPFVSSHEVSENDNRAIDAVVKAWGRSPTSATARSTWSTTSARATAPRPMPTVRAEPRRSSTPPAASRSSTA
jgi:hypothetical protein